MGNEGYIYVLINPSISDAVKIGKTTRAVEERVKELSNATGVVTPFVLVYKELFKDCDFAEKYIHAILDENNYRISSNREFFSIPIHEAIKIIQNSKGEIEKLSLEGEVSNINEKRLGDKYYCEAMSYYYGEAEYFKDYNEAIKLFKKAVNLGCFKAYRYLGMMSNYGEGCKEDSSEAKKYFILGAAKGDNICYAELGILYMTKNSPIFDVDNANKAWKKYFQNLQIEEVSSVDIHYFKMYIQGRVDDDLELDYIDILVKNKHEILNSYQKSIDYYTYSEKKDFYVNYYTKYKRYVERNLIDSGRDSFFEKFKFYTANNHIEVKDILTITGYTNDTVLITDIKVGEIQVGDSISVININDEKTTTVKFIEKNRKLVDYASSGDTVGLMVEGNYKDFDFIIPKAYILKK